MSLLTEQEIEDLYYTELDRRELSFARAVEAKVIEKIKAQGATIWSCDVLQSYASALRQHDTQLLAKYNINHD